MIQIILSDRQYENDVYPLVKAFFPGEALKVSEKACGLAADGNSAEDAACGLAADENSAEDAACGLTADENSAEDAGFSRAIRQIDIGLEEGRIAVTILDAGNVRIFDAASTISKHADKPEYKNTMKRLLYRILSEITDISLPWGILTGIRPAKLAYEMLEAGADEGRIREHMKQVYLCSKSKADLSIRVAKREMEVLQSLDYKNGYSLYVGIPFCPSTCLYCSFPSYPIDKVLGQADEYLKALQKEIRATAGSFPDRKLMTVYLGGGTPTSLSEQQLDCLLGHLKEHFDFSHVREFTVEAGRPDSITEGKLKVMKKWGVSRLSINPQSMQQRTLDLIGRKHTVEQVIQAFHLARETGHDNINMDIIIGLYGESPEDVIDTLEQIKKLNPDSLTVHTLALKRAARLNTEKDRYLGLTARDVPGMLEASIRFAGENGYLPYYLYRQKNMADNLENIGYARYGMEGLYNILIMEEKQTILAIGAGAMSKYVFHSKNRIERSENVKNVADYIGRIDEMINRKIEFILTCKREEQDDYTKTKGNAGLVRQ